MDEKPESNQKNTQEENQEVKKKIPSNSTQETLAVSLLAINQKLDGALQDISRLKEKQDVTGHEVDILQTQSHKAKKWYSDTPVLVSTFALLLSAVATLYPIFKEKGIAEEGYKTRAKEIVQRLTEIQTQVASNLFANIFATTQAEVGNLVDEAIAISNIDPKYINDAGYIVVINQAFSVSKTEHLKNLIWRALEVADDDATRFSLKNSEAHYYFTIKNDSIMGRNSMREAIGIMENQEINDDLKKINIAQEYLYWSQNEFNLSNFKFAEQLLEKAEDLIVKRGDDWKFKSYQTYNSAVQWRARLDSLKAKNSNFFR